MRVSSTTRLALRALGRNVRRTLLSAVGVGVGCALAVFIAGFVRGGTQIRVRSIAESGFGHARIAPAAWEETRDNELRLQDALDALRAARQTDGVKVAAPHARSQALLAFGTRVAGVEMLGVDPPAEEQTNRLIRSISEGRYLRPDDSGATVVGSTIAERLDVELDDDLFLTVVGPDGQMMYAMLRIVGIARTGSRDIDATICHVTLPDLQRFTGFAGAGEITITFDDPERLDELSARLATRIPSGDVVLTWKQILPAQGGDADSDRAFMNLFVGIVVVVVILGVTSAQLTAMLERRREFAVLMALGMKAGQVVRLVLAEATALGIVGGAAGLLLGGPAVYYTATRGIDVRSMMEGDLSISGVLFEPVFYADMGTWIVPHALLVGLVSTVVAALYPAWYVLKTDPTSALSLREA